jgi:hypothetical protein
MTIQSRQFEKFIARIEQAVAPSGAVIKSPDHISDMLTGQLREVDASIRYKVGTCPVLITIECRDRKSIEDVIWIEQLAEKKRAIGASITIAVSSSGFTRPAVKKASMSGIEIRTLSESSADRFIQWLKVHNALVEINEWAFLGVGFWLYDFNETAELIPASLQLLREKGPRAPILVRNSDGRRYHIENILIEWQKRNGTFFPNTLPADGTKIQHTLHQPLEPNCLHVETTKGNFDIAVIHISLSLSRKKVLVPFSRLTEYADPSSALVQTAEWNVQDKIKLSLHRNLKSGETKVVVTPEDEAGSHGQSHSD